MTDIESLVARIDAAFPGRRLWIAVPDQLYLPVSYFVKEHIVEQLGTTLLACMPPRPAPTVDLLTFLCFLNVDQRDSDLDRMLQEGSAAAEELNFYTSGTQAQERQESERQWGPLFDPLNREQMSLLVEWLEVLPELYPDDTYGHWTPDASSYFRERLFKGNHA